MSRFAEALPSIVSRPCFGRPFVCDGLPEHCVAVVIGENPATEMGMDWWSYWRPSTGFDFWTWRKTYEEARLRRGKGAVSNTRRRLDRLRESGVRCLETNVFFNERLDGAGRGLSNRDLLDTVLDTLPNVRFVIAHGAPARRYIESRSLPAKLSVFITNHFRSERYDVIDKVAGEILAAYPAAPPRRADARG
jgi:hypothetical protein